MVYPGICHPWCWVHGHSVYIYLSVNCIFCYVCFPNPNEFIYLSTTSMDIYRTNKQLQHNSSTRLQTNIIVYILHYNLPMCFHCLYCTNPCNKGSARWISVATSAAQSGEYNEPISVTVLVH